MYIATYTALGKELKRYTFMKEEDVKFALELICESAHSFEYRKAADSELAFLSCSVRIIPERVVTRKNRHINVPVQIRKYKGQSFPKKKDYIRTHNIFFFEDELEQMALHFPELGIFAFRPKNT